MFSINTKFEYLSEKNPEEFLNLCSTILVYLEVQFSKYREVQKKRQQNPSKTNNDSNAKKENENFQKLIYKMQKLEYFIENFSESRPTEINNEQLLSASKNFLLRRN